MQYMFKAVLILITVCFCFTLRYNLTDCTNKKVEVVQRVAVIDSMYCCSTFVVTGIETVFVSAKQTKEYPELLNTFCK